MSIDELRDEVKQNLLHMGTEYLYKLKKEPKTFALNGGGLYVNLNYFVLD